MEVARQEEFLQVGDHLGRDLQEEGRQVVVLLGDLQNDLLPDDHLANHLLATQFQKDHQESLPVGNPPAGNPLVEDLRGKDRLRTGDHHLEGVLRHVNHRVVGLGLHRGSLPRSKRMEMEQYFLTRVLMLSSFRPWDKIISIVLMKMFIVEAVI